MNALEKLLEEIDAPASHWAGHEAIRWASESWTYAALGHAVETYVTQLQDLIPSGGKVRVAIQAENQPHTYALILALWKLGAAYVPLSPLWPEHRKKQVLEEAQAIGLMLWTGEQFEWKSLGANHCSKETEAYVLFTSGSTGSPKGVPVSRKQLDHFIVGMQAHGFLENQGMRHLQMFDFSFDVSVASYLLCFLNRGPLCLLDAGGVKFQRVYQALRKHEVEVAFLVPAVLQFLRPYFLQLELPALKQALFAGEALSAELIRQFQSCLPQVQLFNGYGPTEGCILSTLYPIPSSGMAEHQGVVSIGKPLEGTQFFLSNQEGNKELLISGPQVFGGYVQEQLNDEAFVVLQGEKWYATGDMVEQNPDGCLLYLGRKDYQVKVQGYRIEIAEVEHQIAQIYPSEFVVVAVQSQQGVQQLAMAYTQVLPESFKASLAEKLPAYMQPSLYQQFSALPLGLSGKIDRKAIEKTIQHATENR
mgnify:CR=1 FL=1